MSNIIVCQHSHTQRVGLRLMRLCYTDDDGDDDVDASSWRKRHHHHLHRHWSNWRLGEVTTTLLRRKMEGWREEDVVRVEDVADDDIVVVHELFDRASWHHGQLSHDLVALFHQRPRMHRLRQPYACVLVVWRYHDHDVCRPYTKQSEKFRRRCTIEHNTINPTHSGREQFPPRRHYRRRIRIDQTHIPTQQQQYTNCTN